MDLRGQGSGRAKALQEVNLLLLGDLREDLLEEQARVAVAERVVLNLPRPVHKVFRHRLTGILPGV